jgi:hypothetical protein
MPADLRLYQLRITLLNVEPPVWRRILVPNEIALGELHAVIQVAMGWEDGHLHAFRAGKRTFFDARFEPIHENDEDELSVTLGEVAPKVGSKLLYEYDFGDGWEHEIKVEASYRAPLFCIDGVGACPPEDSGGPWGYAHMLQVRADPTHPEHEEVREWLGDGFDPNAFDPKDVNATIDTLLGGRGGSRRKSRR